MRKLILSLLFFMMIGLSLQAQTDFIIRGGLHSIINPEAKINNNTIKGGKIGWNLGADLRFGRYLFLQPGAHFYSSSLTQKAGSTTVEDFKNSVRIQSLKIPIAVGLSPFNLETSDFAIVFLAGIVPTFNLGIKDSKGFIKNDDLTKVNWSGKLGAGVELGSIVFGIDYEFGFNKIFKDVDRKFSVIGLTVGLKL